MAEEEWQDEVRRRDEIIDALMALVKRWKCFGAIDPVNARHLIADSQRLIAKVDAQVAGASRERKYDPE